MIINGKKDRDITCDLCLTKKYLSIVNNKDNKIIDFLCDRCESIFHVIMENDELLCPLCNGIQKNIERCKHCKGDGYLTGFIEYVIGKEFSDKIFEWNFNLDLSVSSHELAKEIDIKIIESFIKNDINK